MSSSVNNLNAADTPQKIKQAIESIVKNLNTFTPEQIRKLYDILQKKKKNLKLLRDRKKIPSSNTPINNFMNKNYLINPIYTSREDFKGVINTRSIGELEKFNKGILRKHHLTHNRNEALKHLEKLYNSQEVKRGKRENFRKGTQHYHEAKLEQHISGINNEVNKLQNISQLIKLKRNHMVFSNTAKEYYNKYEGVENQRLFADMKRLREKLNHKIKVLQQYAYKPIPPQKKLNVEKVKKKPTSNFLKSVWRRIRPSASERASVPNTTRQNNSTDRLSGTGYASEREYVPNTTRQNSDIITGRNLSETGYAAERASVPKQNPSK
jgi:hypothetical protein